LGLSKDVGLQIIEKYNSGLENCVEKTSGGLRQIHGIKGLKVYEDPVTGSLVADVAIERTIGAEGTRKRWKEIYRIIDEEAYFIGRLTKKAMDLNP